jgi:hypothetical protein
MIKLYTGLFTTLLFAAFPAFAQPADYTPDISRVLFHERLDKAQADLLAADGKADEQLSIYEDAALNLQLQYLIVQKTDRTQKATELNEQISHSKRISILRGFTELLNGFNLAVQRRQVDWNRLPAIYQAFEKGLENIQLQQPVSPLLENLSYDESRLLIGNIAWSESPGIVQARETVFLKFARQYPDQVMRRLSENPNYSFTDSLIKAWARQRPEELITYAQARNTPLGRRIANHPDPLVKEIVMLANDKSGQLYFPFLDLLSRNEITREEIGAAIRDSATYYSLLVKTQIAYAGRIAKGDTPVVMRGLQDMLRRKSLETYVNTINGLHDYPAPVRFKKIQGLTAEELYYLAVMNETEIYTSSYMYVYSRMFEQLPVKSSDTLLARVNYDKYKKFLTMAANYNTLDNFLGRMSTESSTRLMTNFVRNLDKGRSQEDIEDAVDVANAYASIVNPGIRKLMLDEVSRNLDEAVAYNNQKGMVIYRLEKVIMQSSDSQVDTGASPVNISDSLGIPPVYEVSNKALRDSSGRIILQMFFYGDAGGKGSFNHFVGLYSDRSKWAMKSTPEWVQFTSIGSPVPFVLFANRALDEEQDLDEQAQRSLITWMQENNFQPSITVHRGHSYYLPYTIKKMLPSKVVVLGSCGAYHNLANVLRTSPDASIIASKQVGYGNINNALYTYLVDRLKMGYDVKWPTMMNEVATRISADKREGFEDYIFPHQNLGALFIKAYRIANGGI